MYIQGRFKQYQDNIDDVIEIRRSVFVEEQGIPEELEFDELDKEALFCVVYETSDTADKENYSVATGRLLRLDDGVFKIGRIAVRKEYRGKQYGDMLVRMLVNKALMCNAEQIIVSAQTRAAGFYQKIGFKEIGEPYMEDGIEHIKMILRPQDFCTECEKHKS